LENIIKKEIDLMECRELKCGLPISIDPEKHIFVDTATHPF